MAPQAKYILTERIAQGGMAEIHLGKSIGSDGFARVCAFKRILPHYSQDSEFVQMFRNEAMVAKQLQNKNIVQVYDFVSDGQSYMLVMEYVDGQDLRAVLGVTEQSRRRIPVEIATYIAIEVLSGLAYAHSAVDVTGKSMGIIHRDVSPQNILLSYEGDVKITDFGIAKVQNQNSNTKAGVLKGKFRYMSPEQALGQNIDARSDIFAVGVILYEMITMTRLFKGEDMVVLEAVRQCDIKPPSQVKDSEVPNELEYIVMKLLKRDMNDRYQTAKDAIKDLSKFLYSFRPDFFAGELAEFMQLVFRDKIETARERVRSTLALPVGVMGANSLDAAQDLSPAEAAAMGPSSVIDMTGRSALGAQAMAAKPSAVRAVGQSPGLGMAGDSPQIPKHIAAMRQNGSRMPVQQDNVKIELGAGRVGHSTGRNDNSKVKKGGWPKSNSGTRGRHVQAYAPMQYKDVRADLKTARVAERKIGMFVLFAGVLFIAFAAMLKSRATIFQSELELNVTPAGRVQIDVDGLKLFKGNYQQMPVRLQLDAGVHQITISRLGFKPKKFIFTAKPLPSKEKENLILETAEPLGQVRIVTFPAGASVEVDNGVDVGVAPHTFEYLPVGRVYTLKVRHPNCPTQLFKEILPQSAQKQLYVRTLNLRNCK